MPPLPYVEEGKHFPLKPWAYPKSISSVATRTKVRADYGGISGAVIRGRDRDRFAVNGPSFSSCLVSGSGGPD